MVLYGAQGSRTLLDKINLLATLLLESGTCGCTEFKSIKIKVNTA